MDMEDFFEKMDPTHRTYFCRMLNMKTLPVELLKQYARVKMMVDRIDGFLSAGDLALIAISANVEESACQPEAMVDKPADESVGQPVGGAADESVDKAVEQSAGQAVGQPAEQTVAQPASGMAEAKTLLAPGMPVSVLHEEDFREGKIVGIKNPEAGTQDPVKITVEFPDGDTVTVNEDEVDAI